PLYFSQLYRDHRDLHSFPTRRSSDLSNLSEGLNKITFEAWDNQGNSSTKSIEIQVKGSTKARILSHTLYPNPSSDFINFKIAQRSEEHTSELQSRENLVCRLLLEKKN